MPLEEAFEALNLDPRSTHWKMDTRPTLAKVARDFGTTPKLAKEAVFRYLEGVGDDDARPLGVKGPNPKPLGLSA